MKAKGQSAKHNTTKAVYPKIAKGKATVAIKKPSVKGAAMPVKKMPKGHK